MSKHMNLPPPRRIAIPAILLALVCLARPAVGEVRLVGTWMDSVGTAWHQQITISKEDGVYYRTSVFHSGRQERNRLVEVRSAKGRRFKEYGSAFGDAYETNDRGWLDLYDRAGFIRSARPIKSTPADSRAAIVSVPSASNESCYQLGVRYGRCAAAAASGHACDPRDDVVKPARCRKDQGYEQGLMEGLRLARDD